MKLSKPKVNRPNFKSAVSLKQVSDREKKLLIGLGVLLLIVLSYYIIYRPLSAQTAKLKTVKTEVDARVTQAKSDLNNEAQIKQEYETALAQTTESTAGFFPKVYPYKDRYLVMLENIIRNNGAVALKITFADPGVKAVPLPNPERDKRLILPAYPLLDLAQKINAAQPEKALESSGVPTIAKKSAEKKTDDKTIPADAVLKLPAILEVQGSYAQIKAVITNLENLNRKLAIEGVVIEKDKEGPSQKATINLSFYAVEKVDQGADTFNAWTIQGSYGKADLFN
jgi:Tfp pilus assembly protein PilO